MKSGVEPDQHAPADQRGGCIFIPGAPVRTVRQLDADSALHAACGARRDVRAVQGPRSLILLFSFLFFNRSGSQILLFFGFCVARSSEFDNCDPVPPEDRLKLPPGCERAFLAARWQLS